MTKFEFIRMLRNKLSDFPRGEVEEQLRFYTEMIEDRMEEGILEEEAVAAVGSVDEIASQIASEIPIPQKEQETAKPKRKRRGWEIVLLIFGSPVWLSLLIAAFAVGISLYTSAWAVIISLWAVFVSLIAYGLAGFIVGAVFAATGNGIAGLALVGTALVCLGLGIFLFYGCKVITDVTILLTRKLFKHRNKEEAK